MALNFKTMTPDDVSKILQYEKKLLATKIKDEAELMIASWSTRWREEELLHYSQLGWSYLAVDPFNDEILGYFIAQPIMFFEGLTQTLWLEHIESTSDHVFHELIEVAYRTAREKNFQRVYLPQNERVKGSLEKVKYQEWDPNVFFINHPRMS